ncbi:MAG: ABC transporter permease [Thermodesulfobacteriota bacterium]
MNQALDIPWLNLGLGYLLIVIPLVILLYYRTGLGRDFVIAVLRMTLQLVFLGIYLEFLFALNSAWVNLLWLVIMTGIAAQTITSRAALSRRFFIFPVFLSLILTLLVIDAFFLGIVLRLENLFEVRYLIPVSGMILGNCMRTNIVALQAFYGDIEKDRLIYRFALANGATRHEALLPYMKRALLLAFNPAIATLAVMGLISIPGMMTGQILGGSTPVVAIKYQIMIVLAIYVTSILSIYLSIRFANRRVFDRFGNIRRDLAG